MLVQFLFTMCTRGKIQWENSVLLFQSHCIMYVWKSVWDSCLYSQAVTLFYNQAMTAKMLFLQPGCVSYYADLSTFSIWGRAPSEYLQRSFDSCYAVSCTLPGYKEERPHGVHVAEWWLGLCHLNGRNSEAPEVAPGSNQQRSMLSAYNSSLLAM